MDQHVISFSHRLCRALCSPFLPCGGALEMIEAEKLEKQVSFWEAV